MKKEAAIAARDYARSQALSPIINQEDGKKRLDTMVLEPLQAVIPGTASRQHAKLFNPNESNLDMQNELN